MGHFAMATAIFWTFYFTYMIQVKKDFTYSVPRILINLSMHMYFVGQWQFSVTIVADIITGVASLKL